MRRHILWHTQVLISAVVLLVFGALVSQPAAAQGSDTAALRSAENLQRQLNQEDAEMRQAYYANAPISERLSIEYGGTFRYAFNIIDTAQSQETYEQIYDLRLFTSIELDGAHRFFGRLRFQYNQWDFRGTRPIGPDYDDVGWQYPIGEIYWYEFNLAGMIRAQTGNKPDYNFVAKVGRQYVIWGQGAALSNYMYAGIFDFVWQDWKATAIIGVTSGNDTIDWDLSRPGYDTDTHRLYYGGKLEYSGFAGHRPYLYLLAQKDLNAGQVALLPAALPTIPTTFNYDSSYVGLGSNGSFGAGLVYRAECIYEYGTTLSDPLPHDGTLTPVPQQNTQISAVAGVGGLTWLARDPADSRIDFQIVAGSGSSDRLDSGNTFGGIAPGAVDTSFNSLGYVNTGLVLAPDFANLLCPSLGWSSSPFPGGGLFENFRLGVTGFLFGRISANAPLSVQTQPGGTNYVGGEVDFSLEWRLLSDLDLSFKYGIFMPNQSAFAPSQSGTRDFVYIGGTFAF
jgi:hypothetical protein